MKRHLSMTAGFFRFRYFLTYRSLITPLRPLLRLTYSHGYSHGNLASYGNIIASHKLFFYLRTRRVYFSGGVHAGLGSAIIKWHTDVKARHCRPRTSSPPTPTRLRLGLSRCVNFDRSKIYTIQWSTRQQNLNILCTILSPAFRGGFALLFSHFTKTGCNPS